MSRYAVARQGDIGEIDDASHEELYLVLKGRASFERDGDRVVSGAPWRRRPASGSTRGGNSDFDAVREHPEFEELVCG